jgi:hypothetical protein
MVSNKVNFLISKYAYHYLSLYFTGLDIPYLSHWLTFDYQKTVSK